MSDETSASPLQESATRRDVVRFAAIAAGLIAAAPVLRVQAAPGTDVDAPRASTQNSGKGGTVTIGRAGDADTLDPHQTLASISWQTFQQIYDPLISFDLNKQYEGIL